jgi:hypothetical protein
MQFFVVLYQGRLYPNHSTGNSSTPLAVNRRGRSRVAFQVTRALVSQIFNLMFVVGAGAGQIYGCHTDQLSDDERLGRG